MRNGDESVSVSISKDLIEEISRLNNVDRKYIGRTIEKILRDEISVEKKIKDFQNGKNADNSQ